MHPAAGGAEIHLHSIFSRIAKNGHQVVLLTTSFKNAKEREMVDDILVIRKGGDFLFQWTVLTQFPKLDKEFNFDIIYEDLNKLPLFLPLQTKKPCLVQMHHLWRKSIFKETNFFVAFGVYFFENIIPLFYKKELFAVVSPSTKKELASLGIPEKNIALIYNGTSGTPENFIRKQEKKNYFLWLSRVHRYKGILVALEAFQIFLQKNPDVRLKIAGNGPMLKKLPRILQQMHLEKNVDLEGFVSKEKKQELLSNAIALLQTSEKEGFGLTVIEAGELGTTTIASEVPGLVDSVLPEKTGILFPVRNAKACATCMERVYTDKALRQTLEENAFAFAKTFDWDKAAKETEDLLIQIHAKRQFL